tara:strand:+ start:7240 stop:8319 length:1080 start_codon:yes stop_codon:yes gene_type:complete
MDRIGIAIDSLAGGGAEKVMITLAETLIKQGHQVSLLVLYRHQTYEVASYIPIYFCFDDKPGLTILGRSGKQLQCVRQWLSDIEAEQGAFDLVLSNLDKSHSMFTRLQIKNLYCVVHNSIIQELKRQTLLGPIAYLQLRRAKRALHDQHVIAVSDGVADEIRRISWIKPKSVQRIYNPYNFEEVQSLALASCSLPREDYIIHVGRVAKQKRHDILFQALKRMQRPMKLVLLCTNQAKALKIAKKYGVADQLILPGFQQNPYPWIAHAKLLVLSSSYEGFGSVLVEAMSLNTPVVSTACEHGPNEILQEDLAKWLVTEGDINALAQKMDEALLEQPRVDHASILQKIQADKIAQTYMQLI